MTEPGQRLKDSRQRIQARIDEASKRVVHSLRATKAIFKATRQMMVSVGLVDTSSDFLYLPGIAYWVGWWALFIGVLFLPTYGSEPFVVFPSALALVIAWLLGMSLYAHTLLSTDFSDVRVTPAVWSAFLRAFQDEGIQLPKNLVTAKAARQVAKELERPLPALVLESLLRVTSLAAVQAVLAGCVSVLGLLIGPTLATVRWWHGWSPVSLLYAAAVPPALSLVFYGLVPFTVARFLIALKVRRSEA